MAKSPKRQKKKAAEPRRRSGGGGGVAADASADGTAKAKAAKAKAADAIAAKPAVEPDPPQPAPPARARPTRQREGSGLIPFLWVAGLLAVLAGGGYASWPFWSSSVLTLVSSSDETPSKAQPTARVADPANGPETPNAADTAGGNAIRDLEAERARFGRELGTLLDRVTALEDALNAVKKMAAATAPPDGGPAAAAAVQALSDRVGYLEDGGEAIKPLRQRIELLEQSRSVNEAADGGAAGDERLTAAVSDISRRLGTLERTGTRPVPPLPSAQKTVVAVGQLREALRSAAPFRKDLEALRTAGGDSPDVAGAVAMIEPYADAGIPTITTLQRRFDRTAGRIVGAGIAASGDGWLARTMNRLASLVTVRRTADDAAVNSVEGVVATAERALAVGDLKAAVAALESLEGPPAEASAVWLRDAHARTAAERALARLHVHAISLLAPVEQPAKE